MHPFLPAFGSGRSRYVRVDELARARIILLQGTIATLAAALLAVPTVSCGKSPTASSPVQDQTTSQPILQSIRIDGPFWAGARRDCAIHGHRPVLERAPARRHGHIDLAIVRWRGAVDRAERRRDGR